MLPGSFVSTNSNSFASMRAQCALDEQKKKLEGDMARHLAFIDRLLADKDKLSAMCMQLGKDIKVFETSLACTQCLLLGGLHQSLICS